MITLAIMSFCLGTNSSVWPCRAKSPVVVEARAEGAVGQGVRGVDGVDVCPYTCPNYSVYCINFIKQLKT